MGQLSLFGVKRVKRVCWRCSSTIEEGSGHEGLLGFECDACRERSSRVCSSCGVLLDPWGKRGGNFACTDGVHCWCVSCRGVGGWKES